MASATVQQVEGFVKIKSAATITVSTEEIDRNDLLDIIRILIEYTLARKSAKCKQKNSFFHLFTTHEIILLNYARYGVIDPAWVAYLYGFP